MRVYTKLSAVIADDAGLARRLFSVEDVEENDDTSTKGGGPGGFVLNGGDSPLTINLQAVNPAKQLVLLVDGSVNVYINGSTVALRVASSGEGKTFVWGKLLLTGTSVSSLQVANTSSSAQAKCMLGYAG
jgi:hypothetical protein